MRATAAGADLRAADHLRRQNIAETIQYPALHPLTAARALPPQNAIMATSVAEAPTAAEEEDLGAQVYLTLTQEDLLDRTSLAYYPAEWASWTKPRQAAWAALPTEPNAYFMAYLAPGERRRGAGAAGETGIR